MARPNLSRHHKTHHCAKIAAGSVHLDATATGHLLLRHVNHGAAKEHNGGVPEEVCANVSAFVSVLAARTNCQLSTHSAAISCGLHGLRLVPVGQHSLLCEATEDDCDDWGWQREVGLNMNSSSFFGSSTETIGSHNRLIRENFSCQKITFELYTKKID